MLLWVPQSLLSNWHLIINQISKLARAAEGVQLKHPFYRQGTPAHFLSLMGPSKYLPGGGLIPLEAQELKSQWLSGTTQDFRPQPHLGAIKQRTLRQTSNVLKFKYIWWVGATSSELPGPPSWPSQRAMPLSTNTSLAAEGWGWGADSPNKAAFNWPEREWQESRSGGRLPAGQEEQV